jgi:hypothetical protein
VTGLPGEENRGLAEDLALLPQLPILPAQPAQLITLDAGEAIATATCVQISLANPLTNSGLGQVQLPGDLADRLAAASDQLDDFSLVLRREEPSGAWHRTPISRAEPSSWVSTKPGQLHLSLEVTDYEPPHRIGLKTTSGQLSFGGTRTFEPIGEAATRVTFVGDGHAPGMLKLAEPLLAVTGERRLRAQLGNLKRLLESQAQG